MIPRVLFFLSIVALSGCVSNAPTDGVVTVSSTADTCTVTPTSAPAGVVTFHVTNDGTDVTELYVYAEDGERIISELENIGPGLTRDLVTRIDQGTFVLACKPGMVGEGIRTGFTVTEATTSATGSDDPASFDVGAAEEAATELYLDYVRDESSDLLDDTKLFAELYLAGRDDEARAFYPVVRAHWERIEPAAESLGDIDPLIDISEADVVPGEEFTGWHRIEKDLWLPAGDVPLTDTQRAAVTAALVATTESLVARVSDPSFTLEPFQIGNGAKELLDEVTSSKMTGEEETWSHTDLWDIEANIQGAQAAFWSLETLVRHNDAALVAELDTQFDLALEAISALERPDDTFPRIDELTDDALLGLSHALDALSGPLSRLTAAVVS